MWFNNAHKRTKESGDLFVIYLHKDLFELCLRIYGIPTIVSEATVVPCHHCASFYWSVDAQNDFILVKVLNGLMSTAKEIPRVGCREK